MINVDDSSTESGNWARRQDKLDRLVTELFVMARHTPKGVSVLAKMRELIEQFMKHDAIRRDIESHIDKGVVPDV